MQRLLQAEILADGARLRLANPARRRAHIGCVDPSAFSEAVHIDLREREQDVIDAVGVRAQPLALYVAVAHDLRVESRQQPGIAARAHLQVQIRHGGRLGSPRVNHDHLATRVGLNRLEHHARPLKAMSLPGIAPQKYGHIAVLEILTDVCILRSEQPTVYPELTSLFLRQGVVVVPSPERRPQSRSVNSAHVVSLPTASVIGDRLTPVPGLNVS